MPDVLNPDSVLMSKLRNLIDYDFAFETRANHAGQAPDPSTGAVMTLIFQTSTFNQNAIGVLKGFKYARTGNPTHSAVEACLGAKQEGS
jgi:cystathionine beta-lyase/cystathionine gamma-synthase